MCGICGIVNQAGRPVGRRQEVKVVQIALQVREAQVGLGDLALVDPHIDVGDDLVQAGDVASLRAQIFHPGLERGVPLEIDGPLRRGRSSRRRAAGQHDDKRCHNGNDSNQHQNSSHLHGLTSSEWSDSAVSPRIGGPSRPHIT